MKGLQIQGISLFLVLILILASSCKKEGTDEDTDNGTPSPDTVNLIGNSSFEIGGQQSLDGWKVYSDYSFVTDVPTGGGNWALCMPLGWVPAYYYIMTTVPSPAGINRYRLSYYGKIRGIVELYMKRNDSLYFRQKLYTEFQNPLWTFYSAFDTLATIPGDSLVVKVISGGGEVLPDCYFDLCKLEVIK